MRTIRIGIIGAGERGCYVLGSRITEVSRQLSLRITRVCDRNPARIADALAHLGAKCAEHGLDWAPAIRGTTDSATLIDDPDVDLILVTTHTDQHRDAAILALRSGKHVYLDKPIAVQVSDSQAILDAEHTTGNTIVMGFTRRYEQAWRTARTLLEQGAIGKLQMLQIRSIIPYTRYFQMWHRNQAWSGGALNDKSSHHLDVFNWMADSTCTSVTAVGGRSGIFAPRDTSPTRCIFCGDSTCPYRREADSNDDKEGTHVLHLPSWRDATEDRDIADRCVFQPGADIIDHAIATYSYANGVKASLFWAIYGPHADDQETLELVGSRGRILLERSTGQLTVHRILDGAHNETVEVFDARGSSFGSSHYGADLQLLSDIRAFCDRRESGEGPQAVMCATAKDGHEALRMVVATLQSIDCGGLPIPLQVPISLSPDALPHPVAPLGTGGLA